MSVRITWDWGRFFLSLFWLFAVIAAWNQNLALVILFIGLAEFRLKFR